jgi:hypothetical protein
MLSRACKPVVCPTGTLFVKIELEQAKQLPQTEAVDHVVGGIKSLGVKEAPSSPCRAVLDVEAHLSACTIALPCLEQ